MGAERVLKALFRTGAIPCLGALIAFVASKPRRILLLLVLVAFITTLAIIIATGSVVALAVAAAYKLPKGTDDEKVVREVVTEMLATLEGMERGPAGNTSLAAAFALAQTMARDQVVVVQETEYTGAGKHPLAQLNLAKQMGVMVRRGDPAASVPGDSIVIPEHPAQLSARDVDLQAVRRSYLRNALGSVPGDAPLSECDLEFLAAETRLPRHKVETVIDELRRET